MRSLFVAFAAVLALSAPALALDDNSEAVVTRLKAGKIVKIADVATFMRGSEKWCYLEDAGSCAWTDIYLDVTDRSAQYEGGAAWNDTTDINVVHDTVFKDGRYICEIAEKAAPTTWATLRSDHSPVGGRELASLKSELAAAYDADTSYDCFDYTFLKVSPDRENIVLRQHQYIDGKTDPANDVEVTLHFNPSVARGLTLRY